MKGGRDPSLCELGRNVAGPLEDEGVMSVRRIAITLRHRVIHKDRNSKRVSEVDGDVQRWILPASHGRPHPVEDVWPTGVGVDAREFSRSQLQEIDRAIHNREDARSPNEVRPMKHQCVIAQTPVASRVGVSRR